jgi:hypothetical protein
VVRNSKTSPELDVIPIARDPDPALEAGLDFAASSLNRLSDDTLPVRTTTLSRSADLRLPVDLPVGHVGPAMVLTLRS